MAKTNVELLDQIQATATSEYRERVPKAIGSGMNVIEHLDQYPTLKNEFINTLTNQVIRTVFYSKVFENPLKMLHGGMLEYGESIEQLFVDMAEVKGFYENEGGDEVKDLISQKASNVHALYVTKNFEYKAKVTISDQMLKGAFRSREGLSQLINQLTSSIVSAIYLQEFQDMKKVINGTAQGKYLKGTTTGTIELEDLTDSVLPNGQTPYIHRIPTGSTKEETGRALTEAIRGLSGRLKFPSTSYNMAGVMNWSNPEDLVFVTTPEQAALLDVNVLAQAFNVSSADLNVRTILVDELPKKVKQVTGGTKSTCKLSESTEEVDANVLGILMDKSFLVSKDTVNETTTFYIADKLSRNLWYHKHGIMASCYFANYVVIAENQI